MTSVADIPPGDDADDELSGISPELVLVDPDLARLVREREAPLGVPAPARPRRASTLRLVAAPAAEPPIVPRAVPTDVTAESEHEPVAEAAPVVEAEPVAEAERAVEPQPVEAVLAPPPPAAADAIPGATTAVQVAERVVDAEPARAIDPPRRSIPAPLAEPARRSTAPPAYETDRPAGRARAGAQALGAAEPVMPHPVKRTSSASRPIRARRAPGKRRRAVALLGAVGAASVAVLAVMQLTGGPSETAQTVAGPTAKTRASRPPQAASKPKRAAGAAAAKPNAKAASAPAKAKTATKKPAAKKPATKPSAVAARSATTTPPARTKAKTPAATKPKTAAPATAKPETAKTAKPAPATPSGAQPATRRFAWAPVAGAIGYHVELFRGAERVLVQETKEPVLELPASWRYQGRTVTLTPGAYRWYVWPVTKSGRATQAVVQAKLTV